MLASPLMPLTIPAVTQEGNDADMSLGLHKHQPEDRGWMGSPQLFGHPGKSHDQPLHTSATTP